jgi:hypothetical protein
MKIDLGTELQLIALDSPAIAHSFFVLKECFAITLKRANQNLQPSSQAPLPLLCTKDEVLIGASWEKAQTLAHLSENMVSVTPDETPECGETHPGYPKTVISKTRF